MKIIIRKTPDSAEHKIEDITSADYATVINGVDLKDMTNFIKRLNELAPSIYWKGGDEFTMGELYWAIFSYLVDKEILLIEDKFFDYGTRENKYVSKTSYFNILEEDLYLPIAKRLIDDGYIIITKLSKMDSLIWHKYKVSPALIRDDKLNELGI
jgi:hypothetical protein